MNEEKSKVVLFLAQPAGTLVGKDKPFANIGDLCKHAHERWGFEGVSAPACLPFIDIDLAVESPAYRDSIRGEYLSYGTPLVRLESHTVGQRML